MAQALDDLLDSLEDADDATREEAAKALAELANPATLAGAWLRSADRRRSKR